MVSLNEMNYQDDHARWTRDFNAWVRDINEWQAANEAALEELRRLLAFVMALKSAAADVAETITAHEEICKRHTDACELTAVDHAAIARACGCAGTRVSHPGELGDALDAALAHRGPSLVDVATDPSAHPPITSFDGRL